MDKARLLERLMATFLDELVGHVRTINDEVIALEADPVGDDREERLTRLFRAAHSLKGAARAVDQPSIEQVCHRMENVFSGLRDERLQPTPKVCGLLLDVADAIESAGMQLREQAGVDRAVLDGLMQRIDEVGGHKSAGRPGAQVAAAPPTLHESEPTPPAEPAPPPTAPPAPESRVPQPSRAAESVSPPAKEPPKDASSPSRSLPTTIRVAEEKLDSLLAQSGELLVARQRVEARPGDLEGLIEGLHSWRAEWRGIVGTLRQLVQRDGVDPLVQRSSRLKERAARAVDETEDRIARVEERLERLAREMTADARQLKLASAALQEDVHRIRMLPFAEACSGLARAVHDVCRTEEKDAELVIEGGEIEVDRSVLEGLGDPLLHLVRNAVDHGLESPEDRRRAGKPETATVTVSAAIQGAEVNVTVSDDGRGLDLAKIRQRVRALGLPEPIDDQELAHCIFLPGFSTADVVTDVSGRGVGMDVVKSRIESLHGRIEIVTEPGRGARFTLSVPLTLTTVSALFVRCGERTLAFPTSTVARLVRFDPSALKRQQGRTVLPLGGVPVRVASLANVLEMSASEPAGGLQTGVLLSVGDRQLLMLVDQALSEREAVIKTLGPRILSVPYVSGAVTLGSGELALLLNTYNLLRSVESGGAGTNVRRALPDLPRTREDKRPCPRVLVVDDSLTTRTLLKSILETAGYDVIGSPDGQDAWERLQSEAIDLVVSDVDMPRVDGFELTELIRNSPTQGQLPIILVTSRDSDADKRRGVDVGADAYLVKSAFDQTEVLETVEQFIQFP
ncbi:hybrid sensor histidine kinase/response regulator [Alienimonas chondri]|uniref:histidine kinase n=1 Tax=Alienimonas chondri TaxID=2681879 RepID=A0ABX1VAN3_9PLAN|nr:hybrid sensor histidine kinase/response regulator [Alienimonas chondri]NNJ25005.1 Sensor histidine kinase RcsC [Alienimonas chondri]